MAWHATDCLATVKKAGRVPTAFAFDAISRIAIGHTRWATHGGVTDANAHPHLDAAGRVAIVHNGIVENAGELRCLLAREPAFTSETDSEVIAHLLGERVAAGEDLIQALCAIFPRLQGQNAVIAIDQREEMIAAAMNVSPLVIGAGAHGSYIASDPFALAGKATSMIVVPNESVVRLGPGGIAAFSYAGNLIPLPDAHPVPDAAIDELEGHLHFMAKEMAEQPSALSAQLDELGSSRRLAGLIREAPHVVLTGCGSAHYAARIGSTWLATLAGIRAVSVPASEFDDVAPFLDATTLVVAVTQSGETADVLEAMRRARGAGAIIAAIVNVEHSSAARFADHVIPLLAGRERSVLATKSMTAMMARLLVSAGMCGDAEHTVVAAVRDAGTTISALSDSATFNASIGRIARIVANADHVYVIGKGTGFGVAQEAALKIKEASYVHAEAFPAGELKHGAIALIEEGTPCLVFDPDHRFPVDCVSSARELRSRGGYTIGIGMESGDGLSEAIAIAGHGPSSAIVQVSVAQHIAYRTALLRNLDPDYPRNLAKSVTVK
jgi:glucosamine--fructose-6-phosphate aminotransferase (isomerizing)